jgi:5S rRNA maturation endonuclease (ribonuclease M5)
MNGDARSAEHKPQQRRRIVATYSYVDEHGAVLFEVVRYQPKDFRQRRPDGNGGYIWSLGDTRRVPYHLPEVLSADEVVIVEGEKDADRLRSLGFTATTSPGGGGTKVGAKWRPEFSDMLIGKRISLLADNDPIGRKHARAIAADLLGKAETVKLVRLPGLTEKGQDVSDWLDAGHTADELRRLIKNTEPVAAWRLKLEDAIDELNEQYFVAMMAGKGVIASLQRDDEKGRERLVLSRRQDIHLVYSHRHYVVMINKKGDEVWKDLGSAWLEHPRRRSYAGIALIPKGPTPAGIFNLWRGFGVVPQRAGWPLLSTHILKVICRGDQSHFDYLVRWCAYCVQYPEKAAEVAVVLRGLKGAGKGTLAQVMLRIFCNHSLHITQPRHLTGNFNAHLADALFLYVDEAFWAGDRQGEGTLKALITEPSIMIEPKGIDPFMMPNRLKIMMASNNEWVVPATADERRYFMLEVSAEFVGDRAYFDKLHRALDKGEIAAFLDYLQNLDLSGFDVRSAPHTRALNHQKLRGLDSVGSFWFDCLREGAIIGSPDVEWPATIATQYLHASYVDHARNHGERRPFSDAQMIVELTKFWEGCSTRRVRLPAQEDDKTRPPGYVLDHLRSHRAAFCKVMKLSWDDAGFPAEERPNA